MDAARFTNLTPEIREEIRDAIALAVQYWPNAHLGIYSPLEDMRSAFRMLRSHAAHHGNIYAGIGAVSGDAYRHMNM